MNHRSQNNYYKSYSYLSTSRSIYSRNTHHQYYDSRVDIQQTLYTNRKPIVTHASLRIHQQYKTSTNISDLAEPLSVFDDIKLPRHLRSNITSFPSVHIPSNLSQRVSLSDARLATTSDTRERLLNDIQHNISEIDQELSSLKRRPSIPLRLSSIDEKTPSSNDNNQMRSNKPKRIYEIIPRIKSQSKPTSKQSIPKRTGRTNSHSYIGQYHYGPEIDEIEIVENDPENSDLKSTINEIPESNSHEIFSLDQFRREQSALSENNRALIFVPEYVNNNGTGFNETAEDSHQNNPTDTNVAQSSVVSSSQDSASANKLNIQTDTNVAQSSAVSSSQDFASANKLNIQTASVPKIKISPPDKRNPNEFSYIMEADSINTMLSKPVKHFGRSKRILTKIPEEPTSSQQTIINPLSSRTNDTGGNTDYFFSDIGDEDDIVEFHIPVDVSHFALSTGSEMISDNIK